MINGYLLAEDVVVLWDSQDASHLRIAHRVTGSLTGSLPTQPKQNNEFGLPLVLQPEETTLLIEQGVLALKKFTDHFQALSSAEIESFKAAIYPELNTDIRASADIQSTAFSPLISIYTKYTIPSPESLPKTVDRETNKTSNDGQDLYCTSSGKMISWNWPKTNEQVLKYRIFKDLWQRGFYITPGLKFGGEYLVYESDPLMVHASFITNIVNWDNLIATNQLATAVRLGCKVKKRTLLCSVNPVNNSVEYLTLHWTGITYNT